MACKIFVEFGPSLMTLTMSEPVPLYPTLLSASFKTAPDSFSVNSLGFFAMLPISSIACLSDLF